jgi:hypothetical protein
MAGFDITANTIQPKKGFGISRIYRVDVWIITTYILRNGAQLYYVGT